MADSWIKTIKHGWLPSSGMNAVIRQKYGLPAVTKLSLWRAQEGKCYYCTNFFALEEGNIEHKHPRSLGGSNQRENLAFTCFECNSEKSAMTEEEYRIKKGLPL